MAKIGIISDTHDVLRPQVMEILKTCDGIIHAGDFTREEILDQLRLLGKVYVVRGNNDWMMESPLQKVLRFEIEGLRFVMAHEKWEIPSNLEDVDVVIFGHSHQYYQEEREGKLWLNPGSCGRRRFWTELTMAVMYVENGRYYVERIDLEG